MPGGKPGHILTAVILLRDSARVPAAENTPRSNSGAERLTPARPSPCGYRGSPRNSFHPHRHPRRHRGPQARRPRRAVVTAQQAHDGHDLLDAITTSLHNVGCSLQAAADLPRDTASKGIAEALQHLDDTIRQIRDITFTTRGQQTAPKWCSVTGRSRTTSRAATRPVPCTAGHRQELCTCGHYRPVGPSRRDVRPWGCRVPSVIMETEGPGLRLVSLLAGCHRAG